MGWLNMYVSVIVFVGQSSLKSVACRNKDECPLNVILTFRAQSQLDRELRKETGKNPQRGARQILHEGNTQNLTNHIQNVKHKLRRYSECRFRKKCANCRAQMVPGGWNTGARECRVCRRGECSGYDPKTQKPVPILRDGPSCFVRQQLFAATKGASAGSRIT